MKDANRYLKYTVAQLNGETLSLNLLNFMSAKKKTLLSILSPLRSLNYPSPLMCRQGLFLVKKEKEKSPLSFALAKHTKKGSQSTWVAGK